MPGTHDLHELKNTLIIRNYSPSLSDIYFQCSLQLSIHELRHLKLKKNLQPKVLLCISTHNPFKNEAFSIILQNIFLLKMDHRMNSTLQTHIIIKSKKQLQNRKIFSTTTLKPPVKKCERPNSGICNNLIEGSELSFKQGHSEKQLYMFFGEPDISTNPR